MFHKEGKLRLLIRSTELRGSNLPDRSLSWALYFSGEELEGLKHWVMLLAELLTVGISAVPENNSSNTGGVKTDLCLLMDLGKPSFASQTHSI